MKNNRKRSLAIALAVVICVTVLSPLGIFAQENNSTVQVKTGTVASYGEVKIPSSPGKTVYAEGQSTIDASNASEGYIMVKQSGVSSRIKVQIIKDGKTYNYDLNNSGNYEVFPLQMGNGNYTVRIMKNLSGSQYTQLFSKSFSVSLSDTFGPFLYPSQYVNYTASSSAVKKAAELCSGKSTELDKVKAVYSFIVDNISYDKAGAQSVQSGYLPKIDVTLSNKRGICFDYAALMACMLRSQGIPTKVIVGTVAPGNINHAWNEVYIKDVGWITVGIESNGSSWERLDSTFAASKSKDIEKYIGTGSNYTALRVY